MFTSIDPHKMPKVLALYLKITQYPILARRMDNWKQCPYVAIRLEPKPIFDMSKCYGCWRCYNRCPKQAIYTEKYRGGPHYPRPNDQLKERLRV